MNTTINPDKLRPIEGHDTICYLKHLIQNPNVQIGDFTFYHDAKNPLTFEQNILYQFPCNDDKLIIGNFCSIASNSKFLFNGGNHKLDAFSTYPFPIFAPIWNIDCPVTETWENRGDIVIGNDVWLGYDCIIMSGVTIGDGAIVGTRAVVTKDVDPYTIVGGIPAEPIRKRFDDETISILLELKWWNWDVEKIQKNISILRNANKKDLVLLAKQNI